MAREKLRQAKSSRSSACPSRQELDEDLAHSLVLLLLHPMAGAVDDMAAEHARAGALLHLLDAPRNLCETPIALAGDEDRGHIDRATRKELELGRVDALGSAAIPLQAALEAGSRIFTAVNLELVLGEPSAGGDLLR